MGKRQNLKNSDVDEMVRGGYGRDSQWYKRTQSKIATIRHNLEKKFYDESAQAKKKETLSKLNSKLRDYKEAIKFKEKFKGLRFFERRKLERKLKQILKKIEEKGQTPEFKEEENKIRKDIEYVKFFPETYCYIPLNPKKDDNPEERQAKIAKIRGKIATYLKMKENKKKHQEEDNESEASSLQDDFFTKEKE